ncbi:MAG: serine/threonine protein kinase, partial [Rhodococcus sp. (in: high G+C Gram-positive bacteria)]
MTRGNGSGRDGSAAGSDSAERTFGVPNSEHESSEATVAAGPSTVTAEQTLSARTMTAEQTAASERTAAAE